MAKTKTKETSLYKNSTDVDSDTGMPRDYDSFAAAYRPLLLSLAEKARIPLQDCEDAVQTLQLKYWHADRLSTFDPDRKTVFATPLAAWARMFLRQEIDKVTRNVTRNVVIGDDVVKVTAEEAHAHLPRPDAMAELERDEFFSYWTKTAEEALKNSPDSYLVPALKVCLRAAESGQAVTYALISEELGCNRRRAVKILTELREALSEQGLGKESLYD